METALLGMINKHSIAHGKISGNTWVLLVENSIVQISVEREEATICVEIEENSKPRGVRKLEQLLRNMPLITMLTYVELIYSSHYQCYCLRYNLSRSSDNSAKLTLDINDLLWAHKYITKNTSNAELNNMKETFLIKV